MAMKRKVIGISVLSIMAFAVVFGTVGSVMEVIAATSADGNGEYVNRLATAGEDNAAIAALKYACPFH